MAMDNTNSAGFVFIKKGLLKKIWGQNCKMASIPFIWEFSVTMGYPHTFGIPAESIKLLPNSSLCSNDKSGRCHPHKKELFLFFPIIFALRYKRGYVHHFSFFLLAPAGGDPSFLPVSCVPFGLKRKFTNNSIISFRFAQEFVKFSHPMDFLK